MRPRLRAKGVRRGSMATRQTRHPAGEPPKDRFHDGLWCKPCAESRPIVVGTFSLTSIMELVVFVGEGDTAGREIAVLRSISRWSGQT